MGLPKIWLAKPLRFGLNSDEHLQKAMSFLAKSAGVTEDRKGIFPTTQWSDVLRAGQTTSAVAAPALERLCRNYWYPLYVFVRRRGHGPEEAQDLTQSFFAFILEKDALKSLTQAKTKFRSFLLAALTNFLNNEWSKQHAQKRGGRHQIISWDDLGPEERYRHEPADNVTPEKLFDRRWAFTLIAGALERLRRESEAAGKRAVFDVLEPVLTGEVEPGFYPRAAAQMNMSEGAVKVTLHRLRRRFGELLRSEVAYTVADPQQIEEEVRYLLAALSA